MLMAFTPESNRRHFVIISIVLIGVFCTRLLTDAKFVKDHGMHSSFPPLIVKSQFEEVPIGHLRSLGHQRVSDGSVADIKKSPNPADFYQNYVQTVTPVVIRDSVDRESPIMALWTDDKFRDIHGDIEVDTIAQKENQNDAHKKMTLNKFLDKYTEEDTYMATLVPHELMSEIFMPTFLQCGPAARRLTEAELWMAHGGAGSMLHYHGEHQVHCVVDGRKDFILIQNKYKEDLKTVEKNPMSGEGYSLMDTEIVNVFEYKKISQIPWNHASLLHGDCIFIPAGYLHQVRSYGRSLSYTIQFAPSNETDVTDCRKVSLTSKPLNSFNFVWTSKNGIEQTANEKMTPEDLRQTLYTLMRTNDTLTFEMFEHFYNTATQKAVREIPKAKTIFNNLDVSMKGQVSRKELQELKDDKLVKVTRILNGVHHVHHEEL